MSLKGDLKNNELDEVAKGEKIVCDVPPELLKRWNEIRDISEKAIRLAHELNKTKDKQEAMSSLFWHDVPACDEQLETSEVRGKGLGIRVGPDGIPVFVEMEVDDDDGHPADKLIRFLKGLSGRGGE